MRKLVFFAFYVACILVRVPHVEAAFDLLRFEHLVVFGDSLSDNGNALKLDPSFFKPLTPYVDGRFSNGPNWVDYFASVAPTGAHFGPVTAFYAHEPNSNPTNFAVGDATSGNLNVLSNNLRNNSLATFPGQIWAYVDSLGGK